MLSDSKTSGESLRQGSDTGVRPVRTPELQPKPLKILIATSSCWKQLDSNQAIRDTWAKYVPENWDLRFFIGNRNFTEEEEARLFTPEWIGSPGTLGNLAASTAKKSVIGDAKDLLPDEILLDCPDSYLALPWKTIESLKWALEREYDGVIRIFTDTYLFPDRFVQSDFRKYDAIGWAFGCGPCKAHPHSTHSCPLGGAAYWLSRKAIIDVLYYTDRELEAMDEEQRKALESQPRLESQPSIAQ